MPVQLVRRFFTVEQYYRMAEAGILSADDRVELIEGEIVEMTPIGSRHAACVKRLIRLLDRAVGDHAVVSAQDPVRLSERSEPQPDLALLRPRADFYAQAHPGPQDILLVVEVAETSASYDREVKLPLYARAGIPEVWLIDLEGRGIEIFRQPGSQGYQDVRRVGREERLAPQAFPDLDFAVAEIMGYS